MLLNGKKIFLTGASGGLGRPLVKALQEAGATVAEHDLQRDGDLGGDLSTLCARLADNPPDILINLAGINALDWCEKQDAETMLRVNLLAPIRLTQAVLPRMKKRNSGQIVNIGSMTGLIPLPYYTCYVASKAGLKGFNDALRRELWGTRITLTHIAPRAIRTPMNEGVIADFNRRTHICLDSPEKIANRIFSAIVKGETDVRIGWPEKFYAIMNVLFPGVIDRGLESHRDAGRAVLRPPSSHEVKTKKSLAA